MARKLYSPHGGMLHLNGNLLCAVDVETTGVTPGYHDLIQVAILPLDSNIKPLQTVVPFYMNLMPQRPENIDYKAQQVSKLTMLELMKNSVEPDVAEDMLAYWYDKLNLPLTTTGQKKLMPLWSNGSFDKSFLLEWLGRERYDSIFSFHERDTQSLALYLNDRFYQHVEKVPFPKVGVKYLASCFGIINHKAHDALSDCFTTAEIYRRLLMMRMPGFPGAEKPNGPPVYFGKPGTAPIVEDDSTVEIVEEDWCI